MTSPIHRGRILRFLSGLRLSFLVIIVFYVFYDIQVLTFWSTPYRIASDAAKEYVYSFTVIYRSVIKNIKNIFISVKNILMMHYR